ncbi:MAG: outer membrane beta-barrel protein [Gemmatimonas sp.]|nr:outer membrane beta-barrel protein [Gemmatimonas sp.]
MKPFSLSILFVGLLLAAAPANLEGQLWQAGAPGEDLGSIRLHLGVLQPLTDYSDGSSLETGPSFGLGATLWPLRHFGLMADVMRSKNNAAVGSDFSALDGQDPTVWLYSLRAAIRYPILQGNLGLSPYIAGGPTAKSYRWELYTPQQGGLFGRPYGGGRDTSFGWNVGGGVEVRLGPSGNFGFIADVRSIRSEFDWFGLRTDQSDLLFTGGITLHR